MTFMKVVILTMSRAIGQELNVNEKGLRPMSILGLRFEELSEEVTPSANPKIYRDTQLSWEYFGPRQSPDTRREDLRTRISKEFLSAVRKLSSLAIRADQKSSLESVIAQLNHLSVHCVEYCDPCGPVEPVFLAQFISKKSEQEMSSIVTQRLVEAISTHPEMTGASYRTVHAAIVDFCVSGANSNMPIEVFPMLLSEVIGRKLGIEISSTKIVFIEILLREALGLDGRIPNKEVSEVKTVANAARLIRALYRNAAAEFEATRQKNA